MSILSAARTRRLAVLLGTVAMCACTAKVKSVLVAPPLFDPLVETKDAVVLVSYQDDLLKHRCLASAGPGTNWQFSLGPPSVEMFDHLMPRLFAEVAHSESDLPSRAGDFTEIQIGLDRFSICPTFDHQTSPIEITYRLTIKTADADRTLTWLGTGRAESTEYRYDGWKEIREFKYANEQYLEQLAAKAMRYALADLIVNLHDDPVVAEWRNSLPKVPE